MRPIYLDYNATTPIDPRSAAGDAAVPARGIRQSVVVLRARQARARRHRKRAGAGGSTHQCRAGRNRVHRRRHRSQQHRDPQRRQRRVAGTQSGGHHNDRASGDRRLLRACCRRTATTSAASDPGADAIVDAARFEPLIDSDTALVTVIHAQNEIGTLQPIAEIARIAKLKGALMHADAAQSVGKVPVDVNAMGVDLLSIAGHKLYAPKGIGVLYMRRGVNLPSVLVGAGQEHGRRPGTENVAFIVALGEACRLASERLDATMKQSKGGGGKAVAAAAGRRARHRAGRRSRPPTAEYAECAVSRRVRAKAAGSLSRISAHRPARPVTPIARKLPQSCSRSGSIRRQALGAVRLSVGRRTTLDDADMAAASLAAAWLAMVQSLRSDPVLVPTL